MTTTSSGDKYILAQMHTNVHSSVLERKKKFRFNCFWFNPLNSASECSISKCNSRNRVGYTETCVPYTSFWTAYTENFWNFFYETWYWGWKYSQKFKLVTKRKSVKEFVEYLLYIWNYSNLKKLRVFKKMEI